MSDTSLPASSVAIVGMAGRFPGAGSVAEFWRNVAAGIEGITVFTPEDLRASGVAEAELANPDYVPARGLVAQPEMFDAAFFGVGPREAALMDPQQRIFLETCWHALEDGAIDPATFPGLVGVWGGLSTGMSNNTYLMSNLHGTGVLQPEDRLSAMLGNENDYLTTRVSYKLNLRGPSVNVQTACSTSLVAVAQACQALATWQCDAALAGGVSVSYPQREGYLFQEGGIGSPDGHCRPFDAAAQGTVFSNGVGVVLLRRLEDAIADGHTIYAVIRGAATNNDGAAKVSFAAPSVEGQAEVIAMAHAVADVAPDSIGYVESHGTGTPLGDPIEVAALTKAFRAGGATGVGYCALGSVKSQVGHLDSAAGVAGLITAAQAVRHATLPPTLHFENPNPECHFPTSPFVVSGRARPWPATGGPRRAGVSSFGIGGTNAHVVLEEAPAVPARGLPDGANQLLVWSAKSAAALDAATRDLTAFLAAHPEVPLADVAHTLRVGRQGFAHRRALVCADHDDAVTALRAGGASRLMSAVTDLGSPAVAFMFAGGGAQHVDMARGLLASAPVFREALERCFADLPGLDLASCVYPYPDEASAAAARLETPSIGLPALFAVEYALARQWMAWGVTPAALIGHSMGEYTAACLAGVMSLEDALGLVRRRGQLFDSLAPGGMVGVPLPAAEVEAALEPGLAIAAVNAADSCVVSGPPELLAAFAAGLDREGVECRRLHINVAAHSPMVEPILAEFERYVCTLSLRPPSIPLISNVTGTWLSAADACAPEYWVRHLRGTVRFADGLSTLLTERNRVLLEVGPGSTLSSFARQHPTLAPTHTVQPSLRHVRESAADDAALLHALGRLWTRGVTPDWSALAGAAAARRVPLPLYPFERRSYLLEPARVAAPISVASVAPLLPPPVAAAPLVSSPAVFDSVPTMTSPSMPPSALSVRSRADRIADRLSELLQKLSGLAAQDISPTVSFLEMGFDSLFLTQASLRFKNEFKVRITFRQLFEDAPTIAALARYIDSKMPADALPAPAPAPSPAPAPVAVAMAPVATAASVAAPAPDAAPAPAALPASAGALERVVHEQLRVMSEQLRMLGGAPAADAAPAAVDMAATTSAPVAAAAPVTVSKTGSAPEPAGSAPDQPAQFGPFRAVDKSQQGLTPHQQRHLDAFTERYTRKTRASKALTEAGRARLADPRAISGFRKIWKELVYQIATERSAASRLWDIDGNEYIDVTSGFGVNIFGYDVPEVTAALHAQVDCGIELGSLSPLAIEAAELICEITGMERATFANTGSESLSGAIRAARTVTGRDYIAVFEDEYHGISEEVLVKSVGPKGRHRSAPAAPGIPDHLVEKVIVLHYDDPNALEVLRSRADEIAAVIIEPVQNRHPDFRPAEMIKAVRKVTADCDIPLIFDEMITGFRLHPRGAQGYFGVDVDMACYGKIMSGGLPIAAIAGTAKYLDAFDGGPWQFGDDSFPEGGVTFFGGTFTRNVLSLAAAVAALRRLKTLTAADYQALNTKSDRFVAAVNALFAQYRAPMRLEHCGSVCNILFTDDQPLPKLLTYFMREKGIHIWDRPFFISMIHTEAELAEIVRVVDESLAEMQAGHFLGEPAPGRGPGSGETPEVVSFTDPQMEVWLGSQLSPAASSAFNEVVALEILTPLDLTVLQHAVDDVTARHESLRMTVSTTPPGFRLAPVMAVSVTVHDLAGAT
ncbi:MAG TPA: aminotransferase class III-fold pyridoxal phosphate-dependent enzyme, partial [Vicinamibacterales bacterium]|nr:aminotransferase class III-fold pyridoxal phosphate-dependent enzyme [Vicinamibacterales bacterium]